jgi:hypothetical protein
MSLKSRMVAKNDLLTFWNKKYKRFAHVFLNSNTSKSKPKKIQKHQSPLFTLLIFWIEIINNKARHTLINAKYRQMAFRLARWRCTWEFFKDPMVKQINAHTQPLEIFCLAAGFEKQIISWCWRGWRKCWDLESPHSHSLPHARDHALLSKLPLTATEKNNSSSPQPFFHFRER